MSSTNEKRAHCVTLYPRICRGEVLPRILWLEEEQDDAFIIQRVTYENFEIHTSYERFAKSAWTLDPKEVQVLPENPYNEEEDYL